jgi:putative ABC transport system permease protein
MREIWHRFVALFQRRSNERDLQRELQFHLDMKTLETGDPSAARRAVGSSLAWRERGRDVWGWRWLDETARDIQFALRAMRGSPGFAAAAMLTLALGIGANCLMFSVVDATLLRPLPFREPERLVIVMGKSGQSTGLLSNPVFQQWRANNPVFEDLGAQRGEDFNIGGGPYPEVVTGQRASANYFQVLGIQAELGRTFLPEEELPGNGQVLLISDHFWRTRFAADPKVIGSTMLESGRTPATFTIVGVLPPAIQASSYRVGDVWKPLLRSESQGGNLTVIGRLKPGVSMQEGGECDAGSRVRSGRGARAV